MNQDFARGRRKRYTYDGTVFITISRLARSDSPNPTRPNLKITELAVQHAFLTRSSPAVAPLNLAEVRKNGRRGKEQY